MIIITELGEFPYGYIELTFVL